MGLFFKEYIFTFLNLQSTNVEKKESGSTTFLKMKFLFSLKKNMILSFGSAKTLKSIYCDSSIFFFSVFLFFEVPKKHV